jgi:hypothetical protein
MNPFSILPGCPTLTNHLDNIRSQWINLLTKLEETLENQAISSKAKLYQLQFKPHEVVINAMPAKWKKPEASIMKALDALEKKIDKDAMTAKAYQLLKAAWDRYYSLLFQAAKLRFFEPNERSHAGFTDRFFRSITFSNVFSIRIWDSNFPGVHPDVRLLDDIKHELRGLKVVEFKAASSDDTTMQHVSERSAARHKSMMKCTQWSKQRFESLKEWCASNLVLISRLNTLRSAESKCQEVLYNMRAAVTKLQNDPLSLEDQYISTYEVVCTQCLTKIMDEWLRILTEAPNDKASQTAYLQQLRSMTDGAENDVRNFEANLGILTKNFAMVLDYTTRQKHTSVINDVYARCIHALQSCSDGLNGATFHPLVPKAMQHVTKVLDDFRTDAITMKTLFSMFVRSQSFDIAKDIDDTHRSELKTHRKNIEQLAAVSDVADYVKAFASSIEHTIASGGADWFEAVHRAVVHERDSLPSYQFMPLVYRTKFDLKQKALQLATNQVKTFAETHLHALKILVENGYTPSLTKACELTKQAYDEMRADDTLFPKPWNWPEPDVSGSVVIPTLQLADLQEHCLLGQRFAIRLLDAAKPTLGPEQEIRFRTELNEAKTFLAATNSTIAAAWTGVQALSLAMAELYITQTK